MAKKDQEALRSQRWADMSAKLSPETQARLRDGVRSSKSEEQLAYDALLHSLSDSAKAGMTPGNRVADAVELPAVPGDRKGNYLLIEHFEGEWPVVKFYKTPKEIAARIKALEGKDVVVVPVYGVILPFTKSPNRVLLLPNDTAVRVSNGKIARSIEVPVQIQDDGFLGEEDMAPDEPKDASDVDDDEDI